MRLIRPQWKRLRGMDELALESLNSTFKIQRFKIQKVIQNSKS
jgi:hypothetical protein